MSELDTDEKHNRISVVISFRDSAPALELASVIAKWEEFVLVHVGELGDDRQKARACLTIIDEETLRRPGSPIKAIDEQDTTARFCVVVDEDRAAELLAGASNHSHWLPPMFAHNIDHKRLRIGLQAVAHGDHWVDGTLKSRPTKDGATKIWHRIHNLTDREFQVLELLVASSTNAQIAESLFVSVPTAKLYVSKVIKKLGVADRLQAAIFAVRHGWLL